jgi:hypothetical protein
MSTHLRWR